MRKRESRRSDDDRDSVDGSRHASPTREARARSSQARGCEGRSFSLDSPRSLPNSFATADYNDEFRTAKGYALGAVDYITSPVVPEILREKGTDREPLFRGKIEKYTWQDVK